MHAAVVRFRFLTLQTRTCSSSSSREGATGTRGCGSCVGSLFASQAAGESAADQDGAWLRRRAHAERQSPGECAAADFCGAQRQFKGSARLA